MGEAKRRQGMPMPPKTPEDLLAFVHQARALIADFRRKGVNPCIRNPVTGKILSLLDAEQEELLNDLEMIARLQRAERRKGTDQ
jgi:hypothetical protein